MARRRFVLVYALTVIIPLVSSEALSLAAILLSAGMTNENARHETDWEKPMESLLLLVLVAAVAMSLLSGYGPSLHRVWADVLVRIQAAIAQTHSAQL